MLEKGYTLTSDGRQYTVIDVLGRGANTVAYEENVMAQRHDKVSLRGYRTIELIDDISGVSYALLQMKCSFVF